MSTSEFQEALAERRAAYDIERGGYIATDAECEICGTPVCSTAPAWAMRQHLAVCPGPPVAEACSLR